MKVYTEAEARELLHIAVREAGSQAALARKIGIPYQNVGVQVNGAPLSKRVLAYLGVEQVRMYRPLQSHKKRVRK